MYYFQLEKGVDGLFDSFARLDSRISSIGQSAAKIGDHLQVNAIFLKAMFYVSPGNATIQLIYPLHKAHKTQQHYFTLKKKQ